MKKVCFICHGNICRSPMAEYIAKSLSSDYIFFSRAVSNEEYSNDIYYPAKLVMDKHHIKYDKHFAKRISLVEFLSSDYIFVMDNTNLSYLKRLFPNENMKKVHLLDKNEIEDPWYTGNFEKVFNQIKASIIHFLSETKI